MSKYGDQPHCENLDCDSQLEIGQAGYLLNHPRILETFCKQCVAFHQCLHEVLLNCKHHHIDFNFTSVNIKLTIHLRNRSAPAVNCCVIIHCLEVSCKEDQITSAQRE